MNVKIKGNCFSKCYFFKNFRCAASQLVQRCILVVNCYKSHPQQLISYNLVFLFTSLTIGVSLLLSAVIDRILTLKVLACSIWMLENSNKLDFTSNYMREHLDTTKCFLHHQKQEIPKWAQHDLGRNLR